MREKETATLMQDVLLKLIPLRTRIPEPVSKIRLFIKSSSIEAQQTVLQKLLVASRFFPGYSGFPPSKLQFDLEHKVTFERATPELSVGEYTNYTYIFLQTVTCYNSAMKHHVYCKRRVFLYVSS